MNKIKPKFFLAMALTLVAILVSSFAFLLVPGVRAATISSSQDQTNRVLSDVLGINPDAYFTQINSQTNTQVSGLPQSQIDFNLISNQSSIRVSASFINNTLNILYLSEYRGTLAAKQPASNTAGMAKDFLEKYQSYSKASFYGTLAASLEGITGGVNVTKSTGNVLLKVLNSNQATVDYVWTYIDDKGTTAQPKNVVLSYYQGQLNCFINNWPIYRIIDAPTISRQQATTTALTAAQNYSYQVSDGNATSMVQVTSSDIALESVNNAVLSYTNFPNASFARDSNPFNLYPSWWVPIGFNKFYPCDVSGIAVTIWADTGQVSSTELMYADSGLANATKASTTQSVGNSSHGASESSLSLSAPLAIVALLSIGALFANKKRLSKFSAGKKLFSPMLWGGSCSVA